MVEAELSSVRRKLLDYGIDDSVAAELDHIHQSGTCLFAKGLCKVRKCGSEYM